MSNTIDLIRVIVRSRFFSGKNFPLIIISIFLFTPALSQPGTWTWMKGDSIPTSGNLGTQGVEDAANTPGSTYEGTEWTDLQGNFWLFGGVTQYDGDLWKYNPSTNNWTWMKGSGIHNDTGSFGIMGVPSLSNYPPARGYCAASWVGLNGDLWLYGGALGAGTWNDLWRYNIVTNTWTWMNGSSTTNTPAVYGTLGIPSPANTPGFRCETSATWVDSTGNLWMFGGDKSGWGSLSDLWKYDIITNEWTWMSGPNVTSQPGVYGVKGIPDPANVPGGRFAYCSWKGDDENFWLFSGGYGNTFNDMWMYNPSTNNWTWMSGADTLYNFGSYGSPCSSAINSLPTGRTENRARWKDACGKFWMYGGFTAVSVKYNDLWNFDPLTLEWSFVNGDSLPNADPVYGTMGVPSVTNQPGARGGTVSWIGINGDLYLFGGFVFSSISRNDLWRFVPDSACSGCILNYFPNPNIASSTTTLCEKYCVDYFDMSSGSPTSWQWDFPGGDPSSSTNKNPANICYDVPGVYDVTLITSNANGSDTLTIHNYLTVYPTPPFPVITQIGYTLTSSLAYSYQWQLNAVDIPGATNQSYDVLQSALYTVIVGDSNGCVNSANQYVLISGIAEASDASIAIYPNPSSGSFTVEWFSGQIADEVLIDIVNILGQIIFSSEESRSTGTADWKKQIDLSGISRGVYFVEIKTENEFVREKILIAK